jgi:hypothetical protein
VMFRGVYIRLLRGEDGLEEGCWLLIVMSTTVEFVHGICQSVAEKTIQLQTLASNRIVVCPCYLKSAGPSTPIARRLLPSTATI